jgi:hypothetical protein
MPGQESMHRLLPLMEPTAGPVTAIYHSIPDWDGPCCMLDFAVASVGKSHLDLSYHPVMPDPIPRIIRSRASLYYSCASLSNLSRVEVCREFENFQRCTGLLLHYEDGTREVVGQYRPDKSTIISDIHERMMSFLWVKTYDTNHLRDIRFGDIEKGPLPRHHGPSTQWSLDGQMAWWFNPKEDYIYINGRDTFEISGYS